MDESNRNLEAGLDGFAKNKRASLRRLILKTAFVTPVVASFAMAGLMVSPAAAVSNGSRPPG
jgi:hypothetical protein